MSATAPSVSADTAKPFDRSRYLTGLGYAAMATMLFSGKAVLIKLAFRQGADPISLLALRMIFALPFFVLAAWWVDRKGRPPMSRREWGAIVLMGLLGYYLGSYLDFLALQYITAGFARVIQYLNPTLVLMLSILVLRKRIVGRQWIALVVAYVGVLLVFWHDLRFSGGDVPLGALLAFCSTAVYAIYLVMGGEMVRKLGSIRLTAYASIVACTACIVQALIVDPQGIVSQPSSVVVISLVNGTFCTVAPVFLIMMSVERVGAGATSQMNVIGPIVTIALAAVVLGEPVAGMQLLGTAVVMAGVFILTSRKA
jgi:drug/metabolite transporter (DMT)-like permease